MNIPLVIYTVILVISLLVQVVALVSDIVSNRSAKTHVINLTAAGVAQALLYSAGLWGLW